MYAFTKIIYLSFVWLDNSHKTLRPTFHYHIIRET